MYGNAVDQAASAPSQTQGGTLLRTGHKARRVTIIAIGLSALLQAVPLQSANAYNTSGCRQTFIDSGGVRKIKFSYFDLTGYTTLSTGAAGRWNSAMTPQQFVSASDYSVFASQQDFGSTGYDGIT